VSLDQIKRCPCGCGTQVPRRTLVCPDGWARVPEALRITLVETQRVRRLAPTDPEAVAEHRAAAAAVKGWLIEHPPPRPSLVTADVTPEPVAGPGRCDSCSAPVVWCVTATGARVPVDPDPVRVATGAADCVVTERLGRDPLVRLVRSQGELFGRAWAHRRHMTTCPFASRYRARARRRGTSP